MSGTAHIVTLANVSKLPPTWRAVTVGNFDGVHRGHQSLLASLRETMGGERLIRCALTFDPHPSSVVAPERTPKALSTLPQRISLLHQYGAEEVVVLRFNPEVAGLTAGEFVKRVLVDGLRAKQVVVGTNFRFARGQEGNVAALRDLGHRYGFEVASAPLLELRGLHVSSSTVRRLLARGEVSKAARLLGRPYVLSGAVVSGRGVGGKMTVPTLNLAAENEVLPADGVYVTRATDPDAGVTYPSITNVGLRPTFDDGHPDRTVETYLLTPLATQPKRIRVELLHWIRAEKRFESPEQLRDQILRDVRRAQEFHRRALRWQPHALRLPMLVDSCGQ